MPSVLGSFLECAVVCSRSAPSVCVFSPTTWSISGVVTKHVHMDLILNGLLLSEFDEKRKMHEK